MTDYTCNEVAEMFFDAEEEFGEHKSTTFLASIVADRIGWDLDAVFDALTGSDYWTPTTYENLAQPVNPKVKI